MKKKIALILTIVLALLSYGVYWAFYDMGRLPKGVFIVEVQSRDDLANIEWVDNDTVIINNQKLNVLHDVFDWRREN